MKYDERENACVFSPDRLWRYLLVHRWHSSQEPEYAITWICLNPSTADENQLDPTLRRIRGYSEAWGYNAFYMLNAFAYRSTDPRALRTVADPVGPENDDWILKTCQRVDRVICAWGRHATFLDRQDKLFALLTGLPLFYLELTKDGIPKHPLYLPAALKPQPISR